MKISRSVIVLSILTGLFALIQSGVGLFSQGGSGPFPFTTLHGDTVQMYGQGIYAYDTFFKAPILRGTDTVTLFAAIPLLVIALVLYRRGSLPGGLLLIGVLSYLLYNASSIALGVAYNNLFLVYIAYFSTCLFAFILAFDAVDANYLAARIGPDFPRTAIAVVMFVSGAALLFAWLGDILVPLFQGGVPAIESYSTEVTYVFDLGIIAPLSVLTGILVLRRAPMGYKLSALMLVTLAIVGLMVSMQTVFQLQAYELTTAQLIGKAGSFIVLAVIAVGLVVRYFRGLSQGKQLRKGKQSV